MYGLETRERGRGKGLCVCRGRVWWRDVGGGGADKRQQASSGQLRNTTMGVLGAGECLRVLRIPEERQASDAKLQPSLWLFATTRAGNC